MENSFASNCGQKLKLPKCTGNIDGYQFAVRISPEKLFHKQPKVSIPKILLRDQAISGVSKELHESMPFDTATTTAAAAAVASEAACFLFYF